MPLNSYISDILKSIKGERLGLDHDNRLIGHRGVREPNETLTSGSTMERSGTTIVSGTTAVFTLRAPLKAGIVKEFIVNSSVSTATMSIVRSTVDGACSFLANTSGTTSQSDVVRLNLLGVQAKTMTLRAISSAIWAPMTFYSSGIYTISTSS